MAIALGGAWSPARAATAIGDYLTVGGFGTLGGVTTNDDEGQFGRDRQIGGARKNVDLGVDSNLGLQASATATSWLSATTQLLAAKRDKSNIEAKVEWAFVTVKPLDGLQVRGGRMAGPVFAVSDSRYIGYANTWLRAPNEVYGLNLFNTYNGGDATYRLPIAGYALVGTVVAGTTTPFKSRGLDAKGQLLKGASLQFEGDWFTLRASKFEMKVELPAIHVKDSPYSFTGIGATLDRDNFVAQAEYVRRRIDLSGPQAVNADGWYVLGGYRVGKFLPYLIQSATHPTSSGIPDGSYVSSRQRTTALGVRWDALSFADVKFQLDRIDTQGTKGISFTTPAAPGMGPPQFLPVTKTPVLAASIAVDFTF